MRYASCVAFLGLLLGVVLGAGACFDDPNADDGSDCSLGEENCSCLQNATCFGTLVCVQGVCLSESGETAGDGDGDGDGDGGVEAVDLFAEACGLTTTWSSVSLNVSTAIPCDEVGTAMSGWMVRYPELTIGDETFTSVISIVSGALPTDQVRGLYNLDDVSNPSTLEFRAEVLLRCADGDPDCMGRFGLAVAEAVPNGLFQIVEDHDLLSGAAPLTIAVPLDWLSTLSEPSVVLVGERTEDAANPAPELLIANPRLVLP